VEVPALEKPQDPTEHLSIFTHTISLSKQVFLYVDTLNPRKTKRVEVDDNKLFEVGAARSIMVKGVLYVMRVRFPMRLYKYENPFDKDNVR